MSCLKCTLLHFYFFIYLAKSARSLVEIDLKLPSEEYESTRLLLQRAIFEAWREEKCHILNSMQDPSKELLMESLNLIPLFEPSCFESVIESILRRFVGILCHVQLCPLNLQDF